MNLRRAITSHRCTIPGARFHTSTVLAVAMCCVKADVGLRLEIRGVTT